MSKSIYGYVTYDVQESQSHFIFSKPKVVPLKSKSLAILELFSVFLAFKGMFSLLRNFHKYINNIFVVIDVQVVLTCVLSDSVKTKNQYTKNHIRDIHRMKKELEDLYKIPFQFKYVPTSDNPATLILGDQH